MDRECAYCGCALEAEVRVYCEDCAAEHGVCDECATAAREELEVAAA